jgi:DnaJ-class molecular chaperone
MAGKKLFGGNLTMKYKYKDIIEAKELLNLPERASLVEIKSNYRELIKQWHPDKCKKNNKKCNEMTRKIIFAYNVIITYCNQYQYSFAEEEVKKYLSVEDWWLERFGNDSLWG